MADQHGRTAARHGGPQVPARRSWALAATHGAGVTSILAGMSTAGNSQTAKSVRIVTEQCMMPSVFMIRSYFVPYIGSEIRTDHEGRDRCGGARQAGGRRGFGSPSLWVQSVADRA